MKNKIKKLAIPLIENIDKSAQIISGQSSGPVPLIENINISPKGDQKSKQEISRPKKFIPFIHEISL